MHDPTSSLHPLNPQSGIPEGSIDSIDWGSLRARWTRTTRIDRSGIPEGSIDSIDRGSLRGGPLRLDRIDSIDRGPPRARSTRSIGDPLGLDRFDRSGIPEGSIDSIDGGSLRARSTRVPEGSIDSIDRGSLRARSTRLIGDPRGLDRLDRSGIPEGSML